MRRGERGRRSVRGTELDGESTGLEREATETTRMLAATTRA